MKSNLKEMNEKPKANICPYLALKGDTDSYAAFPSTINVCTRGHQSVTPAISHQRFFCLTPNHDDCPYFQSEESEKFPKDIQYQTQGLSGNLKRILLFATLGVLLTVIVLLFVFGEGWRNQQSGFAATQTQVVAFFPTQVDQRVLLTDTPQIEGTVETGNTPESIGISPTATMIMPTPTRLDPVLALDTPIGGEVQFIIHRVLEGESLLYFADRYKTSAEAILAVNENLILPLWVDWVIVIPVGIDDPTGLPSIEAYQVTMRGLTVEALAEELSVEPTNLSTYNNVPMDYKFSPGEWILVPRE